MKQTFFLLSLALLIPFNLGNGQNIPQPGYGTMGAPMPPPQMGPYGVQPYPNSMPMPTVQGQVTPPAPNYQDPYGAPPPNLYSVPPQASYTYGSPAPGAAGNYNGQAEMTQRRPAPPIVNYDSIEFNYRYMQPKNKGLDGANTIGGTLMVELMPPLFLRFGAHWGSGNGQGTAGATNTNYDFASVQASIGFHTQLISPKLQFTGEAGLIYASLKATNTSLGFSDGAIFVRPALRFTPVEFIELQAGVTVSSADKYDSKVLDMSSYFRVMPMFDVGVGFDYGDTTRGFRGNLRVRW